jgi:predicted metal-binding membrane protein
MNAIDTAFETAIRGDRLAVTVLLAAVIGLAWLYLLAGAGMGMSAFEMTRMSQLASSWAMAGAPMMRPAVWSPGYAALMFFMWWIMMVAMMLPSAAPMILLFATVNRKQSERGHPYVATSIFALAYLAAWAGFSLLALTLQSVFESAGFLSPALRGNNVVFGSVLPVAAGVYQFSPIKHACLRHCRTPLSFLSAHWR